MSSILKNPFISKKIIFISILATILSGCAQSGAAPVETPGGSAAGPFVITFDYEKQPGSASNQFAVWIEDLEGGYVKTLYATRYTVNGGYKNRPDSIALWAEKSGLAHMQKSETDAITGATPQPGVLSYNWDLTDSNGVAVNPGEYIFYVEGTLRWKNRVVFSGVVNIGEFPQEVTALADYTYEASERQAALTDGASENKMITNVSAAYDPALNPYLTDGDETDKIIDYKKITAHEARRMMDEYADHIILDVRTDAEYFENRIEGSVLIPDYEIGARAETELPDKGTFILIYCRSGRRSANAARELIGLGYTNVFDFGGINEWPYETVKGE